MRKHARSSFIKILLDDHRRVHLLGGRGDVAGGDQVNVAAMVDGEPISAQATPAPTSGWSASTASFTART